MAVREHKAIPVEPAGNLRVMLKGPPERFGHIGHAHGGPGVATIGALYRIHR